MEGTQKVVTLRNWEEETAQAEAKAKKERQEQFEQTIATLPPDQQAIARAMRERIEAKYAEDAPPVCKEFGLNAIVHRSLVEDIIKARRHLTGCKNCEGKSCAQLEHQYQQPKIEITGRTLTGGKFEWETCEPVKKLRLKKRAEESALPRKYRGLDWQDYQLTEENARAMDLSRWLIQTPGASLYLYGNYGSGKTFLATLIGKEFLRGGRTIIFGTTSDMLTAIQETFDKKELSMAEIVRKYTTCDLLIMDDLGRTKPTPWQIGMIQSLLNARYNAEQSVLITSNYSLRDLKGRFDKDPDNAQALISRLCEMCQFAYSGSKDYRMSELK